MNAFAPAGTSPTRNSRVFTSFGTPTITCFPPPFCAEASALWPSAIAVCRGEPTGAVGGPLQARGGSSGTPRPRGWPLRCKRRVVLRKGSAMRAGAFVLIGLLGCSAPAPEAAPQEAEEVLRAHGVDLRHG